MSRRLRKGRGTRILRGDRVLLLAARPTLGGPIPKIVPAQVRMLESLGFEVEIAHWGSRSDNERAAHKLFGGSLDLLRVMRVLRAGSHGTVLVNTAHGTKPFLRDIPLLLLTRRSHARRILLLHGSRADSLSRTGGRLFKLASRFIARGSQGLLLLSTAEERAWKAFEPRGRYAVVVNPFVPSASLVAAAAERDGRAPRDRADGAIIFVGRLIQEKGAADLLDAVGLVNKTLPCRLLIAGSGPLEEHLKNRARELQIVEKVSFSGYLSDGELAKAYAEADLLALPTWWNEGFPTVIAEAMSVGLPIVTTRIRGAADLLQEGENCLFAAPRDPEGLAEAVLALLKDGSLMRRMSRANIARAASFSPEAVGDAYRRAMLQETGMHG